MRAILLAAALCLVPAVAHASGGGLTSNWGGEGASAPGRAFTYIALPMHRGSLVQAVKRDGGEVHRWKFLNRRYGVPVVAMDGSMTGLSADGRVLVLSDMPNRFPPARSRLLILRATNFKQLETFNFPGWFSVAAISPHGRYVYLSRHTAPTRDPNRTELMVLDRGNPGAPEPVAAATTGLPTSRVSDGRWAYTLYQGANSWVQGLDTVTRTTRRFDLPQIRGNDLMDLHLDGNRLRVGTAATIRL